MLHHAVERQSLARVLLEQLKPRRKKAHTTNNNLEVVHSFEKSGLRADLGDEVARVRHARRTLVLDARDLLIGAVVAGRLERRLADEQLVAEHSERPQVDLLVMRLVVDHLGRQVVERAANCRASRRGRVHRPAFLMSFSNKNCYF